MKKVSLFLIAAVVILVSKNSFAQAYEKGDNLVTVGYGFPANGGVLLAVYKDSYVGVKKDGVSGPIYAKFEHAITNHFGMGLNFATVSMKYKYTDENDYPYITYTDKYSSFSLTARANFHFGSLDKFDPYAGVSVGYRHGEIKYGDPETDIVQDDLDFIVDFPVGFDLTAGVRYYVSYIFGIYAELGAAKSYFQGGVTFKF